MSTRANIVIKATKHEKAQELYRHSDGYPDGTLPTLELLMKWIKVSAIQKSPQEAAAWLIIIGAMEYGTIPEHSTKGEGWEKTFNIDSVGEPTYFKVGSYQLSDGRHFDVSYKYTIDLEAQYVGVEKL